MNTRAKLARLRTLSRSNPSYTSSSPFPRGRSFVSAASPAHADPLPLSESRCLESTSRLRAPQSRTYSGCRRTGTFPPDSPSFFGPNAAAHRRARRSPR